VYLPRGLERDPAQFRERRDPRPDQGPVVMAKSTVANGLVTVAPPFTSHGPPAASPGPVGEGPFAEPQKLSVAVCTATGGVGSPLTGPGCPGAAAALPTFRIPQCALGPGFTAGKLAPPFGSAIIKAGRLRSLP